MSTHRTRWAAIGAAVAVTLGAGGIGLVEGATPPADESGAGYLTVAPCRLVDTRPGDFNTGPLDSPIGPGETAVIDTRGFVGDCLFDATPVAMSINVTVVDATEPTFVTVFGAGDLPDVSTINVPSPGAIANAAISPIGPDGQLSIYNRFGEANVIIDVNGYFADS